MTYSLNKEDYLDFCDKYADEIMSINGVKQIDIIALYASWPKYEDENPTMEIDSLIDPNIGSDVNTAISSISIEIKIGPDFAAEESIKLNYVNKFPNVKLPETMTPR